jgi:hypothetical protein
VTFKVQSFTADLNSWELEREERAQQLSKKHGMKVKEVRRRMLSASSFKAKRGASLYNAKISRLMRDMNAGTWSAPLLLCYFGLGSPIDRVMGERFQIPDVKRMVREDPSLLDGFTEEEEAEMLADVVEKRKCKQGGTRANNIAANADAKRTMEHLMLEVRLASCTWCSWNLPRS